MNDATDDGETASDGPTAVLREDPALGSLVATHGPVTVDPHENPFERLLVSIVRQQVSMDAAASIRECLFDRVDPTPAEIRAVEVDALRAAGLSRAKAEYAKNFARAWEEGDWSRDHFQAMDDEDVVSTLTAVRGIGPWTAKMFLLFGLGREDVFPVEDLGIRKAMRSVVDPDLDRSGMRAVARRWRPYRSYASLYLWRAID
ncbi:MAG: DNA-3-methyladenine glycosylase [Halanaeroarchaeum sp.]